MLQDLQEGMRKRNPDSVSSLIRATASDQVEQQRKQQATLIGDLKAELAGNVVVYVKRCGSDDFNGDVRKLMR
jgi:putative lipoic acid-binding regulatory protein